jgi:hypothetical protein
MILRHYIGGMRLRLTVAMFLASFALSASAAKFPIANGLLQTPLDAGGQTITNVASVVGTNGLPIGGTLTNGSPLNGTNLIGTLTNSTTGSAATAVSVPAAGVGSGNLSAATTNTAPVAGSLVTGTVPLATSAANLSGTILGSQVSTAVAQATHATNADVVPATGVTAGALPTSVTVTSNNVSGKFDVSQVNTPGFTNTVSAIAAAGAVTNAWYSGRGMIASQCGVPQNCNFYTGGGTGASTAINSNLLVLSAAGGGTFWNDTTISNSELIDKTIFVPNNVAFLGVGMGSGFFVATNLGTNNNIPCPAIANLNWSNQVPGNFNIRIGNFALNANGTNQYRAGNYTGGGAGVFVSSITNCELDDIYFYGNPNFAITTSHSENIYQHDIWQNSTYYSFGTDLSHNWGPNTGFLHIARMHGNGGDDTVTIAPDEQLGYLNGVTNTSIPAFTWGGMNDVLVEDVFVSATTNNNVDHYAYAGSGVRVLTITNRLERITINGVFGYLGLPAVYFNPYYFYANGQRGNVGIAIINNVNCGQHFSYVDNSQLMNLSYGLIVMNSKFDEARLSNIATNNLIAGEPVYLAGTNTSIGNLFVEGKRSYLVTNYLQTLEPIVTPVRNWTFDEGSGSTDADSANNNFSWNTLTNTSTTWVAGIVNPTSSGSALSYNGSSSYSLGSDGYPFGQGDFTISLWLNPASFSGTPAILETARIGDSGARTVSLLITCDTSGHPQVYQGGGFKLTGSNTLTGAAWNHLALKRSNGVMQFYINGARDGATVTDTYADSGLGVTIGRYIDSAAGFYNGSEDDVKMFNRALSDAEIAGLYSAVGAYTGSAQTYSTNATLSAATSLVVNISGFPDLTTNYTVTAPNDLVGATVTARTPTNFTLGFTAATITSQTIEGAVVHK